MDSFLKEGEVIVAYLPQGKQKFLIRELSARGQIELLELHREGKAEQTAALVCKHGVVGWQNETVEAIEEALSTRAMADLAKAIYALSGVTVPDVPLDADAEAELQKKLSASSLNGGSSTALP